MYPEQDIFVTQPQLMSAKSAVFGLDGKVNPHVLYFEEKFQHLYKL